MEIEFSRLENAIACGSSPVPDRSYNSLRVCAEPDPYVPPTFHVIDGDLSAEMIFVKAPAAVGKSITAQYLSAKRQAPLLNLAEVAVAADSLRGLVDGYSQDAKEAFHEGELTIVVDALDEGRMCSGEAALEQFFTTTVSFLSSDRRCTNRPKLVFFGREESAEFSNLLVKLEDDQITTSTLRLDFFGKEAALSLIDKCAHKELRRQIEIGRIKADHQSRREALLTSQPMDNLKENYFLAIESALEVESGSLWRDDRGRAFAGYAPVLVSIGTLLASVENPLDVTRTLTTRASSRGAWNVLDVVIEDILQREKKKLTSQLQGSVPTGAYSRSEQLHYLVQLLGGKEKVTFSGDLKFDNQQGQNDYVKKVNQLCAEHPFVRSGKMTNDVLGSVILAYAVCQGVGLSRAVYLPLLRGLAKGPFLWRSVRKELGSREESVLDGEFLGYVMNSRWNDSLEGVQSVNQQLVLKEEDDGFVGVSVSTGGDEVGFRVVSPVAMYGRMRNTEIDVPGVHLRVEGATLGREDNMSLFYFQGQNRVRCGHLEYSPKLTDLNGSSFLWLEAASVVADRTCDLVNKTGAGKYGWGGAVGDAEPWRHWPANVDSPYSQPPVAEFISRCKALPASGVVLTENYSIPDDDDLSAWARKYGRSFSEVMKLLVERKHAVREQIASRRRERKFRIKLRADVPWDVLREEVEGLME